MVVLLAVMDVLRSPSSALRGVVLAKLSIVAVWARSHDNIPSREDWMSARSSRRSNGLDCAQLRLSVLFFAGSGESRNLGQRTVAHRPHLRFAEMRQKYKFKFNRLVAIKNLVGL